MVVPWVVLHAGLSAACAARPDPAPPMDPILARGPPPPRATRVPSIDGDAEEDAAGAPRQEDAPRPHDAPSGEVAATTATVLAEPEDLATTPSEAGKRLSAAAAAMLGHATPRANGIRYRSDCSGFTRAVFASVGVDLYADGGRPGDNGVSIIHRFVSQHGRLHTGPPLPGDLVFFDDTYDRSRNGRRGDPLTHVGVVERVEADGTVVFIHLIQHRVVRGRLNLDAPGLRSDAETGRRLNDYLRRPGDGGPRLAGELFNAYGRIPLESAPAPASSPAVVRVTPSPSTEPP
jgi:peptidoglycan DL-endopeptidase CwlO